MADEAAAPRSRRALLTAAAGAAGALAASAVLPLTAAADDPNDVAKGTDNPPPPRRPSRIPARASASRASSTGTAGVPGWSVEAPDPGWYDPATSTAYTGVFGSAPPDPVTEFATGVWGDSPDIGVFGSGSAGSTATAASVSSARAPALRPRPGPGPDRRRRRARGPGQGQVQPIRLGHHPHRQVEHQGHAGWRELGLPGLRGPAQQPDGPLGPVGRSGDRLVHDLPEHHRHLGDLCRRVRLN